MFCLRSWLPLLFIPTNASPFFILSFVVLTYILHRPCIYCSALLLILFTSSCQWSDHCFFDVRGDWFAPRFATAAAAGFGGVSTTNDGAGMTSIHDKQGAGVARSGGEGGDETFASFIQESINSTVAVVAGAALEDIKRKTVAAAAAVAGRSSLSASGAGVGVGVAQEWTGIGLGWLRSLLGRREWTIPCLDVKVQL